MLDVKTDEAIFKYGIIHELICGTVGAKTKFIEDLCKKEFTFNGTKKITISAATVYRLLQKYNIAGIDALKRIERSDKNSMKVINQSMLDFAINLRKEVPTRTTATVLEILKDKFGANFSETTLNNHLRRLGYSRVQLKVSGDKIFIRFQKNLSFEKICLLLFKIRNSSADIFKAV